MIEIETERLLLRTLQPSDHAAYYSQIYGDPDVMYYLPSRQPITRQRFDERVPAFTLDHWKDHGFGIWVVIDKTDNRLIGHCGLKYWPDSPDVEVLYALAKADWGRGIATEAARASLRFGFEHLQLTRIIAAAHVDNIASRHVIEKLGMSYERTEEWRDLTLAMYAIDRAKWQRDTAPYQMRNSVTS